MAVTITADELATASGLDTAAAGRLLPVATTLVEDYASAAPSHLQDMAVIRYAGYVARSAFGALTSKTVGPVSQNFQSSDAADVQELRCGWRC